MKIRSVALWTMGKVALALALMGAGVLSLRRFDRDFPFVLPKYLCPVGIVLTIVGSFLVLRCGAILSAQGIGEPG